MSIQAIIFLLLGSLVLVLLIVIVFLVLRFYKTNKKIEELLGKGKIKDFKEILLAQKDKSIDLEKEIKGAILRVKKLEEVCETTIQKTSVVRFNPFGDIGGDQSFIIALLDDKNNGFLISSLFVKDGSRVYAKSVRNGKSEKTLSKEEIEALDIAINKE